MTPADHILEVLARGSGWKLRGRWPVLEVHSPDYHGGPVGTYVIVHLPHNDTWGAGYLQADQSLDLDPDEVARRPWPFWYRSAMGAADEVEEIERLKALRTVRRGALS